MQKKLFKNILELKKSSHYKKKIRNKNLFKKLFKQTKKQYIRSLIKFNKPDFSHLNIKNLVNFKVISQVKDFNKNEIQNLNNYSTPILNFYQNHWSNKNITLKLLSKDLNDLKLFFRSIIKKFCKNLNFSFEDEKYIYNQLINCCNNKYFENCENELTPETKQQISILTNIEYFCNKIVSQIDHHKKMKIKSFGFKIKVQPKYEGNYFSPEFFELFVKMNIKRLDLYTEKYLSQILLFQSNNI